MPLFNLPPVRIKLEVDFCWQSTSASMFDVLCIPRCFSAHHKCKGLCLTIAFLTAQTGILVFSFLLSATGVCPQKFLWPHHLHVTSLQLNKLEVGYVLAVVLFFTLPCCLVVPSRIHGFHLLFNTIYNKHIYFQIFRSTLLTCVCSWFLQLHLEKPVLRIM